MKKQYLVVYREAGNTQFRNVLVKNAQHADHARFATYIFMMGPHDVLRDYPTKEEVHNRTGGHCFSGPFEVHHLCDASMYVVPYWSEVSSVEPISPL